jgi:uncharacterized membrane protein
MLKMLVISNLVFLVITAMIMEIIARNESNRCEESVFVDVMHKLWGIFKSERPVSKYVLAVLLITALVGTGIGIFFGEKINCLMKKIFDKVASESEQKQ